MVMYWLVLGCCLFGIIATVASLLHFDDWWIRAFDFPRVLILIILLAGLLAMTVFLLHHGGWHYVLGGVLLVCIGYQISKIYAYTPIAPYEVVDAKAVADDDPNRLSLFIANVLMTNHESEKLLAMIRDRQPDIVLTLETNTWWEERLDVLEKEYKYTIKVPMENLYGMHLYSRLPLANETVRYLMQEDIPSIRTTFSLPSGQKVNLFALHPTPPSPTENYASTDRDAELLLVAKEIEKMKSPVIVAGDLNDVAWSYTTNLFQDISGLIDPRKGRGFYSTFHAKYFFFRWPLDHVFHSNDFTLVHLERLPSFGSDHFPIFLTLYYDPSARAVQEVRPRRGGNLH